MTNVVFYFQVHQPFRLRRFKHFASPRKSRKTQKRNRYFDDEENQRIARRVADRCYLPMNALLRQQIEKTDGRFRCAFGISGVALEQLERWAPDALESFQELADTGLVEFICETSHHSLAALGGQQEFIDQVRSQRDRIESLFKVRPTTFRNTELIFDNTIAHTVEELGFELLLGEGSDGLLNGRSAREVYRMKGCRKLKLLLRDYQFSDDIAFRFSNRDWECYPLMADTFAGWMHSSAADDDVIGLFMDYETFGEHQGTETGIFEFMEHVPEQLLTDERFAFATPSEAVASRDPYDGGDEIDAPDPISWADAERDTSAWLGNTMQQHAHEALYALAQDVQHAAKQGKPELLEDWRKLTTSDHFYYMCTKYRSDGDVHEYFTPYRSPHDSFVVFMNVLDDLTERVQLAAR
jgi:alpha-amylase